SGRSGGPAPRGPDRRDRRDGGRADRRRAAASRRRPDRSDRPGGRAPGGAAALAPARAGRARTLGFTAMEERYAAFPSLELDRPAPHVLRLTLRAPGRLNAVSGSMHGELAGVWRTIGEDEDTRAVIVRGADGA